jgi:hypothetical protein
MPDSKTNLQQCLAELRRKQVDTSVSGAMGYYKTVPDREVHVAPLKVAWLPTKGINREERQSAQQC